MTVNERAKMFIEHRIIPNRLHKLSTICYINGAIDQRKLDIEKACEWLRKQNITRGRYDFINALRKAMEEEQ